MLSQLETTRGWGTREGVRRPDVGQRGMARRLRKGDRHKAGKNNKNNGQKRKTGDKKRRRLETKGQDFLHDPRLPATY